MQMEPLAVPSSELDGSPLAPGAGHLRAPGLTPASIVVLALAMLAALVATGLSALNGPSAHVLSPRSSAAHGIPITLTPVASASIGASERSFWATRSGTSLRMTGGGVQSTFTPAGTALRTPRGNLTLSLAAVGRPQRLGPLAAARPTAAANRVIYRSGSITEFYRNGPYGLEQGFTVLGRPQAGVGPLVLALRLGGSLTASQVGSRVTFTSRSGAPALVYGQLAATDATGRSLPARIEIRNGTLRLMVDDNHARYPLQVDPFIQQTEALTPTEAIGMAHFGQAVALSGDGTTALVGGYNDNGHKGAAWVFTRSGSSWTQQGEKLTAGEQGASYFGASVALSSDGSTALISGGGMAWVFTRSGSSWTREGTQLTPAGEAGPSCFGSSVALAADGNTALIGGRCDSGEAGAAWVFIREGSSWTQQGEKLTGEGEVWRGEFGASVALSSNGNTALIGGPSDEAIALGYQRVGAVWVFTREGSTWSQQGAKLNGTGESGEGAFGDSVALSSDGNTALVGGPYDDHYLGGAWAFTREGSTWTQQGEELTGKEEFGQEFFGESVALSSDGNTALIGSRSFDDNPGAWVFARTGSTWTQQGEKLDGAGEPGQGAFGESVALSSDGNTALVGAPEEGLAGAAWVYEDAIPPAPTLTTAPASSVGPTSATLSASVNPHGALSNCHFEYGATRAYGSTAPCTALSDSAIKAEGVSWAITALKASTTYHFRIVGANGGGISYGADRRFRTLSALPSAAIFRVTDLGTLGGATSRANAINNAGEVTGQSETTIPSRPSGGVVSRAFRYRNGELSDLGPTEKPGEASIGSDGAAINSRGDIVGAAWSEAGGYPVIFKTDGSAYPIPCSHCSEGGASGINNAQEVVGSGGYLQRPWLNNSEGVTTILGEEPPTCRGAGRGGAAFAIDNLGQVVGESWVSTGNGCGALRAFLYSGGTLHNFGTLGGNDSRASALNEHDGIVGASQLSVNGQGVEHAVSFHGSTLTDLGTLSGGTETSSADALNNQGLIVGSSGDRAFAYYQGRMYDLNSLIPSGSGWTLTEAKAVNDSDEIVGTGLHNGIERAFLLTLRAHRNRFAP